ncbi:hypothetical protein PG989_007244 [Apiospora arundinis]
MAPENNTAMHKDDLTTTKFRVIIVGAGIAGLAASHCLQKAGIDHVVLERRTEIDPPEGASFAVYPHGARILHQIGCLDAAKAACKPCLRYYSRGPDGIMQSDNGYFDNMKRIHGQDILLLERRQLLRVLYNCLPDKTPIRTGTEVKSVTQNSDMVEVVLGDGTVEKGDMVLGCDGVYSQVRNAMWTHANAIAPEAVVDEEKKRIQTGWKCLVGTGPPEPGLGERDMTSTSDEGFSFLALTQPDRAFWFVFCKLDTPVVWPQRVAYSEVDADALAEQLSDHPVSESVSFGRLWRRRHRGVLIPIQEGVLRRWYSGRVVLAGDAAHKMTPNIGLGGNTGLESVAVLCNHLVRTLQGTMAPPPLSQQKPTQAALERCFQAYQDGHRARVERIVQLSRLITRVQAWDSPLNRWVAVWIMPKLPDGLLAQVVSRLVRGAPKLDYVTTEGFPRGTVEWLDSKSGWSEELTRIFLISGLGLCIAAVSMCYYGFVLPHRII